MIGVVIFPFPFPGPCSQSLRVCRKVGIRHAGMEYSESGRSVVTVRSNEEYMQCRDITWSKSKALLEKMEFDGVVLSGTLRCVSFSEVYHRYITIDCGANSIPCWSSPLGFRQCTIITYMSKKKLSFIYLSPSSTGSEIPLVEGRCCSCSHGHTPPHLRRPLYHESRIRE